MRVDTSCPVTAMDNNRVCVIQSERNVDQLIEEKDKVTGSLVINYSGIGRIEKESISRQ